MCDVKDRSKDIFNRHAATYDHDRAGQHSQALFPAVLEKLSALSCNTILDLGCGTGALLEKMLAQNPALCATGLDLAENMLIKAKDRLLGRAELVLGDAESMPFADGSFDAVCCTNSFHHYPAPEAALSEIHRVMMPGGTFILGDSLTHGITDTAVKHGHAGDVHMYSEPEIRKLLAALFTDITWEMVSASSYVATAKKHAV